MTIRSVYLQLLVSIVLSGETSKKASQRSTPGPHKSGPADSPIHGSSESEISFLGGRAAPQASNHVS